MADIRHLCKHTNLSFRFFGLLLCLAFMFLPQVQAETLKIGGSGVDLGTMRTLGSAFAEERDDFALNINPTLGQENGIAALLSADLDLAISTRPPNELELAAGVSAVSYGKTAIVFATKPSHPLDDITTKDLVLIYSGSRQSWQDGSKIQLVLRDAKAPETLLLREKFPVLVPALEKAYANGLHPVSGSDQESASRLERLNGALGTTSLSVILGETRKLKPLSLNGVKPSPATIADNSYPLTKTLYFLLGPISEKNPTNALALEFITFVKSAKGRLLLGNSGHQVL